MRTLVLDIETRPNLAYVWGLWDQNVGLNQLIEAGSVICWAAKWLGEKKVHFASVHHDGKEEMLQAAWDLMDEADAIVHFNGKSFDIKHLNREFLLTGMTPPSPHKDIDLLTVVRGRFKFVSNKLQHVANQLGVGSKEDTGGFDLWVRCMAGEKKAWTEMKRYNVQDVRLTEDVYEILRPWVKGHPHIGLLDGTDGCANCGDIDLRPRGFYFTNTGKYQRRRCGNCGAWSRDKTRIETVSTSSIP